MGGEWLAPLLPAPGTPARSLWRPCFLLLAPCFLFLAPWLPIPGAFLLLVSSFLSIPLPALQGQSPDKNGAIGDRRKVGQGWGRVFLGEGLLGALFLREAGLVKFTPGSGKINLSRCYH